ncbi:MAG: 50S ribosomal protein L4 [Candidatus Melainabacteria bacterium RIFCSPLOWO2_02_FULL_35_15]|nr:MAG: 50S ribosomal protein L4 [Candidatus Melainabacteria bacterium RIFCSPLOWO2_12_FULL_35_11]OGI12851.1 MAG: 50S ribosomal protein L4 [Candidatus Melainabacteria bacterium RIFCSPLOWO2_02_FULL_35_15]
MAKSTAQHSNEKSGSSKLPEVFLGLKPNKHLLHLSVLRQLDNQRAGTASTKTKAEVRGGGKKPWKQKGTGRARAGSIRSPLWVGGGITFGPKPRSFKSNLPQKARNLAELQAIVTKSDSLVILKNLPEIKDCKTKNFLSAINSLSLTDTPLLILASKKEQHFNEARRASKNIPDIVVRDCNFAGVWDILKVKTLAITEHALKELEKRFLWVLKNKKMKTGK